MEREPRTAVPRLPRAEVKETRRKSEGRARDVADGLNRVEGPAGVLLLVRRDDGGIWDIRLANV